jgi:hypothetical protein
MRSEPVTKPGENPDPDVTTPSVESLHVELKRLRRPGLTDLAFRPQRYPALLAALSRHGDVIPRDTLGRIGHNLRMFGAAVAMLPTDPLRRAACILFHVGIPGTLPALEVRRRAADRAYTGKPYARQPDTIQRHLERDLLDPLLAEALQCLQRPASSTGQTRDGSGHDGNEAPEDELDRAITGLERRDLSGAAAALGAWLAASRHHGQNAEIDPPGTSSHQAELDRMNRRALLRKIGLAGTLAALPPTQPSAVGELPGWLATRRASKIDGTALDDLNEINSQLWRIFTASRSKRTVFTLARLQVDALVEALDAGPTVVTHRRLCAMLGDVLQLTGEVFFDREQYVDAAHCYTVAANLSREAQQWDLWSCALTRHAFIGVYERRFADAVPMLEQAARVAKRGDPQLSTRQWVDVVAAQAFAGLRNSTACRAAIDSASVVEGLKGPIHNGGWLRFDGRRLDEERGACYVELGHSDEAEGVLLSALQAPLSERRRGNVLADLAMIGAQRADAENTTTFGWQAVNVARQTGSGVVGRRLQALQPRLRPMLTNPGVRELHDGISALRHSSGHA